MTDFLMEHDIVSISDEIRLDNSKPKSSDYDGLIMLSYAVFAITFLVLIYAASKSSGTASGDFASMVVFP
jgi:GNAT superfamily N-acetyltransferase